MKRGDLVGHFVGGDVTEFEVIPPFTPTRRARARVFWRMIRLIWTCLRTGYRFRVIVTEEPTQNEPESR